MFAASYFAPGYWPRAYWPESDAPSAPGVDYWPASNFPRSYWASTYWGPGTVTPPVTPPVAPPEETPTPAGGGGYRRFRRDFPRVRIVGKYIRERDEEEIILILATLKELGYL